jgi:flavorubredoxin
LAKALVDTATIIIASPTVLKDPHPKAFYAAYLTNALPPKAKFASIIGSYGWGGKMVDMVKETLTALDIELLKPVLIKGQPAEEDYIMIDHLADSIYEKHKHNSL